MSLADKTAEDLLVDDNMETDDKTSTKRTREENAIEYIGPDGEEVTKGKRAKILHLNEESKSDAVRYALALTIELSEEMKLKTDIVLRQVIPATALFSISYRIHDYMRGLKNTNVISEKTKKRGSHTSGIIYKNANYSLTSEQAKEVWERTLTKLKINIKDKANIAAFFARTNSIVTLMNLFGQRLKELRIGPDAWISTERNGKTLINKIEKFGISPSYKHYMSGIGWDVSMRSTLSKHTTGLCQLALLSIGLNKGYSGKQKENVDRHYSYIPYIRVVSEYIRNNTPKYNAMIIDKMAHLTNICGDQHKKRASPSFSCIYKHCVIVDKGVYQFKNLEDVGFSSKKSVLLLNSENTISAPIDIDNAKFRQIYYHAFMGTHGEDLGILAKITNEKSWQRREDMNAEFFSKIKLSAIKEHMEIQCIKMIYYSKNITATQNNPLASSGKVYGVLQMFAGFRTRRVTEGEVKFALSNTEEKVKFALPNTEEEVKFVLSNTSSSVGVQRTAPSILQYLCELIERATIHLNTTSGRDGDARVLKKGRVCWKTVSDASFTKGVNGNDVNTEMTSSGITYWS